MAQILTGLCVHHLAPAKKKPTQIKREKFGSAGFKKLLLAWKNEVVNVSNLGLGECCKLANAWG